MKPGIAEALTGCPVEWLTERSAWDHARPTDDISKRGISIAPFNSAGTSAVLNFDDFVASYLRPRTKVYESSLVGLCLHATCVDVPIAAFVARSQNCLINDADVRIGKFESHNTRSLSTTDVASPTITAGHKNL